MRISGVKKDVPRIFTYYTGIREDRPIGFAVIDSARGKVRRFRFILVVGPDLSMRSVEILSYHDTRGAGIRQRWFKRQFIGKRITDPFRMHEDIHAVTGATISCEALVETVRIAFATLTVVISNIPIARQQNNLRHPR